MIILKGPFLKLLLLLLVLKPLSAWGLGAYVDQDGEFSKQVLKIPYAFWNEKFGFTAAYVHEVTGFPQKQSALIGYCNGRDRGQCGPVPPRQGFACIKDSSLVSRCGSFY